MCEFLGGGGEAKLSEVLFGGSFLGGGFCLFGTVAPQAFPPPNGQAAASMTLG